MVDVQYGSFENQYAGDYTATENAHRISNEGMDAARNGFFKNQPDSRLNDALMTLLPQAHVEIGPDGSISLTFPAGDQSNLSASGSQECQEAPEPECPDPAPEPTPEPEPESEPRLPYTRRELGAKQLLDNFQEADLDGDGFLRAREVKTYLRQETSRLVRNGIRDVLKNFGGVTRLENDQVGREVGASEADLARLIDRIQTRGKFSGHPAPETDYV